ASCHTFRGNALRLWFAIAAQLLPVTIRNVGLVGTELARAQDGTPRNKLFKVGAIVSISVRRIHVRLSSAFPRKQLLVQALARLRAPDAMTQAAAASLRPHPLHVVHCRVLSFSSLKQEAHESHRSGIKQTAEPQLVAWQADEVPGQNQLRHLCLGPPSTAQVAHRQITWDCILNHQISDSDSSSPVLVLNDEARGQTWFEAAIACRDAVVVVIAAEAGAHGGDVKIPLLSIVRGCRAHCGGLRGLQSFLTSPAPLPLRRLPSRRCERSPWLARERGRWL
ncbi:MAG: hypothetical protein GY811_09755, partial [Myxococcales bacterium]|nr:hypothetical protein [Myxococcales bacterium]